MSGVLEGLRSFILGMLGVPTPVKWVLWSFLAVIHNVYWLLCVLRVLPSLPWNQVRHRL